MAISACALMWNPTRSPKRIDIGTLLLMRLVSDETRARYGVDPSSETVSCSYRRVFTPPGF